MSAQQQAAVRIAAVGTDISCELEIKRSQFITRMVRVDAEAQAREFIASVKATYPDARHHCQAFVIAPLDSPQRLERSSDDGEPAGTAGMPMLDVLRGSGIANLCCVVVRYFGGVKLGTGGLVRAYSDAVAAGLEQVESVLRVQRETLTVAVSHAAAGKLEAELRGRGVQIVDVAYGAEVVLTLATPDVAATRELLAALTAGQAAPRPADPVVLELDTES